MSSDMRKPSYSLPQNLIYLMKHMWKYNRNIFLFTSISALSGVMISDTQIAGELSKWEWVPFSSRNNVCLHLFSVAIAEHNRPGNY